MGTTITAPLTVEEFAKIDLPNGHEWELHNGEIVDMGLPSLTHRHLQGLIRDLLRAAFGEAADVTIEYTFEMGANDVRSADVGATTKERARNARHGLVGAPELVVEVISPSNTVAALKEYRRLCFANGTAVFLTVDADDRTVEMHVKDEKNGRTHVAGDTFEFKLFGTTVTLAIDQIFGQE